MKKKQWIHYGICAIIALAMFIFGLFTQGMPDKIGTKESIRVLSDSFLFPGVFLGGIGALSYIASKGTFDMLNYGVTSFLALLFHPQKSRPGFYEYVMEKSEKRKSILLPEFIIGMICMIGCVICTIIYG